jgi:hypothetical protein
MRKLLVKVLLLIIPVIAFFALAIAIKPANYLTKNLIYAQNDKDSLLAKTSEPRVVIIGGSNASFGLDGQILKDSLKLNPVNMSIHGSIGLKYMLRNALRFIRKNDIVVVSPEYQQFYGDNADGKKELLTIVFDVSPDTRHLLDFKQSISLLKSLPDYCVEKFDPFAYQRRKRDTVETGIYGKLSYNSYGDACKHWGVPRSPVMPMTIDGELNENVFELLDDFRKQTELKQAKLFITFPGYQDMSFKQSVPQINLIEKRLRADAFVLLGTPERYKMPDSLMFDTPYHLTYPGVKLRTNLLVADLKKNLPN